MDKTIVYGDLKIDFANNTVTIGKEKDGIVCEGKKDTWRFYRAYKMGREHKKSQIKEALGI